MVRNPRQGTCGNCWLCISPRLRPSSFSCFLPSLQHAFVIHFTLEGCVCVFTLPQFRSITAKCVEGSEQMRMFVLPEEFIQRNSSQVGRTITIPFALVCEDRVFAFVDHQRLTKASPGDLLRYSQLISRYRLKCTATVSSGNGHGWM